MLAENKMYLNNESAILKKQKASYKLKGAKELQAKSKKGKQKVITLKVCYRPKKPEAS